MSNCTFYKPETGHIFEDLETKITETFLNLQLEMGPEKPCEAMFRMFEIAFPLATEQEKEEFTKIQGAFRCISQLVRDHAGDFAEMLAEQQDYKNSYDEKAKAGLLPK